MTQSPLDGSGRKIGALETDLINSYTKGHLSRRQFVTRGSIMGLSVAFMGTIVAACGDDKDSGGTSGDGTSTGDSTGAAAGEIKQGGTLRIASQKPGSPLDPVAMDNLGSYTPVVTAFEYLVGKGDGAALAPMLAESWSPNDDGSVWTFKLRSGVKWHDGKPFTSADVVATLDRLAPGNLQAYIVEGAAKAIDDLTVEVTLNAPDGQFPAQLGVYNPQSVITPADYVAGTTLDAKPNGTGPFKLDKFDIATGATFVRNDEWWAGKPFLDKLEFIFSDSIDTQVTGLLGGAADAIVQFSVQGGDAVLSNPDVTVESIRGSAHRMIWMNTREGNFTDVRVRQAVALGIDRQALIDTVLKGKGDIGNDHPIAPVYEFWDSAQPQRTRDIEKAKALLKDAGKEGLKVTLVAPVLQEIPQLAELIQSQLKEIGMEVELNVLPYEGYYDNWCKVYDSTVAPAGCDGGAEFGIVDYGNRATPDVFLVKAYATGEWNSAHYISEPFNAAVAEYQASLDLAGRKGPISTIQKTATEDVPYVIPYFYNSLTAYKKNVSGIVATGLGHFYCGTAGFLA